MYLIKINGMVVDAKRLSKEEIIKIEKSGFIVEKLK